jgi:hypothetical protein
MAHQGTPPEKDTRTQPNVAEPESSEILYLDWQQEYQTALLELAPQKLSERVAAAEAAISKRFQALSQSPNHVAEWHAIDDARAGLRVLKTELEKK